MFAEDEWRLQEDKFRQMPITNQQSRVFNRLYFSGAIDVVPDKQGRILLPQYLKDYAEMKKDVVVVGVSNRVEIWSAEQWREFYGSWRQSFEDIAERLVEPGK
jgi:MraZ protein